MATHSIEQPESSLIFSAACNTPLVNAHCRIERSADKAIVYSFEHRDRTIIVNWYDNGEVALLIKENGKLSRSMELPAQTQ